MIAAFQMHLISLAAQGSSALLAFDQTDKKINAGRRAVAYTVDHAAAKLQMLFAAGPNILGAGNFL